MIPKIIHYCWLSGEPFPKQIKKCITSWKEKLSDYQIWLWDTNRFDINSVKWVSDAFNDKKYAFAADYIRFYALYNYGGIYLDSDVTVLKSFNNLLDNNYFFGFEFSGLPEAAIIGTTPHQEWIKNCIEWYEEHNYPEYISSKKRVVAPIILKYSFEKNFNYKLIDTGKKQVHFDGIIFPYTYFSPKNSFNGKLTVNDNTYCIHQFNAAWINKKSINTKIRRMIHLAIIALLGHQKYVKIIYIIRNILHKA